MLQPIIASIVEAVIQETLAVPKLLRTKQMNNSNNTTHPVTAILMKAISYGRIMSETHGPCIKLVFKHSHLLVSMCAFN